MPKKNEKKLWGGRFSQKTSKLLDEFNASISFDKRLFGDDIKGSVAHALVLEKAGILSKQETQKIISGLMTVSKEISRGKLPLTADKEDIHMAVEARLTELVGPLGGKLHTGRSRNDQIATDIRLYLKDEIKGILTLLKTLKSVIVKVAEDNIECIMPGYTHLQRAQPVLFSHHMLSYFEMLTRDEERFTGALTRTDRLPLGSGALAGSPYKLDRKYAAKMLGFSEITNNSIDAVSDRDFAIEFVSASAMLMMHLSRLSEELIIWATSEFGFIELSDAFSTGSSIMPQKKNPDIPELVRGKTARVYGNLMTLLTMMKGLPLAYNKDMQEDKEPLFDTVDTVKAVLEIMSPMLLEMKINAEKMIEATKEGFLTATDAADYLTAREMPFREAHEITGKIVAYSIKEGKTLEDLTLDEWRSFSELFDDDIKKVVTPRHSLNSRKVFGGTALTEVKKRLKQIEKEG